MTRSLVPLVLVLVLVLVPGIVSADDSHPIWEKNVSDLASMMKVQGKDITVNTFGEAVNFCYDPADGETAIVLTELGNLEGEGTWNWTFDFNDGSTVTGTTVRTWNSAFGIPVHETDTELNGEWLNITELLIQPGIQITAGTQTDGIWRLFARSGFTWINPPTVYPGGSPAKNPIIRFTIEGPGTVGLIVWTAPYEDIHSTVGTVDEITGETGWIALLTKMTGGITDMIGTAFGFLSYFTLADLPLVFLILEATILLVSLDGSKDIFQTGEKWITYNEKLIGGILRVYETIVSIINQVIGIFKP